ncbi:MAG: ribosomal protein [Patescibacteria group bacterium]|jgi:ribosomal protein L29|nr:ribosomal protein [Patescibacteria group bacterium]
MNFKELEGKSQAELAGMLAEDRTRLHALNMKRAVNQVKDVREIREIRQRVARIMTKISTLKVQD